MAFPIIVAKAVSTVVTGAVGVAAYNGAKKLYEKAPVRKAVVSATELGLRAARKAEVHAESARLAVSDVVAEARDRIGEEVPPPTASDAGHGHAH
ncbi:Ni,Fe-hydrogenase III small subunit [Rhodococcus cercidiphylli]|nr:Ni,Fe-hydrogenase III small subunit [Rhodococcus cercidiphylli]